jgi:hypothetical protein
VFAARALLAQAGGGERAHGRHLALAGFDQRRERLGAVERAHGVERHHGGRHVIAGSHRAQQVVALPVAEQHARPGGGDAHGAVLVLLEGDQLRQLLLVAGAAEAERAEHVVHGLRLLVQFT